MNDKFFYFTVDDNIRFLHELTKYEKNSLFSHPYTALLRRMHEKYGVKIQLNLFYEREGFNLSEMTDKFAREWAECADWLKLSFHSRLESLRPYERSEYGEVLGDAGEVHREILRFAGEGSLAKTTTVHYCLLTEGGINALRDSGIRGLLGLYGDAEAPRLSYQSSEADAKRLREGEAIAEGGIIYRNIDIILNKIPLSEVEKKINALGGHERISVMIHEQYFYPDYVAYQPDFEEKLDMAFDTLLKNGYSPSFFEDETVKIQ